LVVIGIGGSYLGAKAGIDFIQGFYNINKKMEIIFVGESLSATDLLQKLDYLENKSFAINVISKSGTTIEPSIAFRIFKNFLKEKVGPYNAKNYIFATTDANKGLLLKDAVKDEYPRFVIPDDVGGRYSVLTPVGLFPLLCSGVNIDKIIEGAKQAKEKYDVSDLNNNDAYKYAVARQVLSKKYPIEMMIAYEPQMGMFNE
jgi:glucose-6-phosphate isomerase